MCLAVRGCTAEHRDTIVRCVLPDRHCVADCVSLVSPAAAHIVILVLPLTARKELFCVFPVNVLTSLF